MQANPVAIRIRNPCHPAYARLDWFDEDFDAAFAANLDGSANVIHHQCHARRPTPVPFGMAFMARAVETKGQRFRGELTPEIIPLLPRLRPKSFW